MTELRPLSPVLGLIPAKGGSNRLKRKNVLSLGGKPLLQWAAEAGKASGVIDELIVSTEDSQIAEIARDLGLEVPFMRPEHLARDPAGVVDVALHALQAMRDKGRTFNTLIILLPTCPFRSAEDIRAAFQLFRDRKASFLMSVSQYDHSPFSALRLTDDGCVTPFFPEYVQKQSQRQPIAYRANGAIHVLDVKSFVAARSYYAEPLLAYVMPWDRSIDIDTEADLTIAEGLLRSRATHGG